MKLPIALNDKVLKTMKAELQKRKISADEYIELLIKRDLKIK